ncbi:hypothetical protein MMPV_009345 [Pyropia vietnamensis]
MAFLPPPPGALTRSAHRALCLPPPWRPHGRDDHDNQPVSPPPSSAVAAPIDGDALLARVLPGPDRLSFLHNQSTAAVKDSHAGAVIAAALTTHTGRLVDVVALVVAAHEVLVVGSPSMGEALMARFDKYLFPGDEVELADVTGAYTLTALLGGGVAEHLTAAGAGGGSGGSLPGEGAWVPLDADAAAAAAPRAAGEPWLAGTAVLAGSSLGVPGVRLLTRVRAADAGGGGSDITAGLPMLTAAEVAALRVWAGVPAAGAEITDAANPLDARLWAAVSWDKGCYLGQETIARLRTYDGVRMALYGVDVAAPVGEGVVAGDAVHLRDAADSDKPAGVVTSVVSLVGGGAWALAYLRVKGGAAAPGVAVLVGKERAPAVVRDIVHASSPPPRPPSK